MIKFFHFNKESIGRAPGDLEVNEETPSYQNKLSQITYNKDKLEEKEFSREDEIKSLLSDKAVNWINIDSIEDVGYIKKITAQLNIHPLITEDIVHVGQRPKIEDMDDYIFIVLKMLTFNDAKKELMSEQVSMVLFEDCLVTFQEHAGDVFEPIRNRIRQQKGIIRNMQGDYLAYCLMDSIIDNYFLILEKISDRIEELEEKIVSAKDENVIQQIHLLKRQTIYLRKSAWPLREMINKMTKGDNKLIKKETEFYLKDLYDHSIQVIDTLESFRDLVSGLLDTYLTNIGNRMNQVMQVLTIMATIFIPLTFIAGIYGMNFENMPELKWKYGYFAVLIAMGIIALGMLSFFKKKKWL